MTRIMPANHTTYHITLKRQRGDKSWGDADPLCLFLQLSIQSIAFFLFHDSLDMFFKGELLLSALMQSYFRSSPEI